MDFVPKEFKPPEPGIATPKAVIDVKNLKNKYRDITDTIFQAERTLRPEEDLSSKEMDEEVRSLMSQENVDLIFQGFESPETRPLAAVTLRMLIAGSWNPDEPISDRKVLGEISEFFLDACTVDRIGYLGASLIRPDEFGVNYRDRQTDAPTWKLFVDIYEASLKEGRAAILATGRLHFAELSELVLKDCTPGLVSLYIELTPEEERADAINRIIKSFKKIENRPWHEVAYEIYESPFYGAKKAIISFVDKKLSPFEISAETALAIWTQSGGEKSRDKSEYFGRNMEMIKNLEKARRGSVALLNQEFGIFNFCRYPKELLLRQIKEKDRADMRYGIILYPYADYNAAFALYERTFREMRTSIPDSYAIRIAECGGRFGVAKLLVRLDRKYGDEHKIAFAVIGGHGNPEGIRFGP